MEGRKLDTGKVRWSLLPDRVINKVLDVLEFGARKYDIDNWKKVPDARRRYYDAAMRHIDAWWSGEAQDKESGFHHLAHATCCLLFLLWIDTNGIRADEVDDFKESLKGVVETPFSPWIPITRESELHDRMRLNRLWELEYRDAEGDIVAPQEGPVDFRYRARPQP